MTKDDIIRMAREAGLHTHKEVQTEIFRFAELVADAKREACVMACDKISQDQWALYKGRAPHTVREAGRASEYVQGKSDGADDCADAIRAMGQAPKSSAVDRGAETGPKQAETRVNIGLDGGWQHPKKELEHDNHGPQCSGEEMLLRGILASELRCWRRLTDDEAENLVAFVKSMPPKNPEPSKRVWGQA